MLPRSSQSRVKHSSLKKRKEGPVEHDIIREESETISAVGSTSGSKNTDTNGISSINENEFEELEQRFEEDCGSVAKIDGAEILYVHNEEGEFENICDQPPPDFEESEEEDINIPTEENYFKSSTSVSGDDEAFEVVGRPRSVHFEDEFWEGGRYVSRALSRSDGTLYLESSSSTEARDSRSNSGDLHDVRQSRRPSNVKSARKESVREMLRKRREEIQDSIEPDGRRRLKSSEEESRTLQPLRKNRRPGKYNQGVLTKTQSMYNVGAYDPEKYRKTKTSFPLSQVKKGEAFITSRDLAALHSLVRDPASNSSSSSSNRSTKRSALKKKKKESSVGGLR